MGYYKDRQKTQDLQNNMGYSEKWLFSTNRHFVMNQFVLSFMRKIYFRIIFWYILFKDFVSSSSILIIYNASVTYTSFSPRKMYAASKNQPSPLTLMSILISFCISQTFLIASISSVLSIRYSFIRIQQGTRIFVCGPFIYISKVWPFIPPS